MKKLVLTGFAILTLAATFTSCRDTEEKTEAETLVEEMQDEGADIKVKEDDGDVKIKMETDDKKVKIKEDDGDQKIKIKTDNDDN
ncbi:MAG: hypothetical protein CMC70_04360 [Flavobacteriaceae bacterium]|nr:hypothetical protein [Flavobacteriaceae bacterium]